METIYRVCYNNLQQVYSWSKRSIRTSVYGAIEARSSQENEENSKSARDFKIVYAQDI